MHLPLSLPFHCISNNLIFMANNTSQLLHPWRGTLVLNDGIHHLVPVLEYFPDWGWNSTKCCFKPFRRIQRLFLLRVDTLNYVNPDPSNPVGVFAPPAIRQSFNVMYIAAYVSGSRWVQSPIQRNCFFGNQLRIFSSRSVLNSCVPIVKLEMNDETSKKLMSRRIICPRG